MENIDAKKHTFSARQAYVSAVALLGTLIFGWAVFNIDVNNISQPELLVGLIILNTVAQVAVVSTKHRGVAFGTSQAVNLAAVAIFGLEAGVIVAALASLSLVAIKTVNREKPWKNTFEQTAFNTGMETIALFCGGMAYVIAYNGLGGSGLFATLVAWLAGSLVFDQINRFVMTGIIYITRKVKPLDYIRANAWAIPINIAIGMVGGYLLTEAIIALNWQGILLFVMPLMLSAYSLRMYVKETDKQMDVVLDRTSQLSEANNRLEQLASEKDRMLAVLSHDMRTSLSALQASAEMLQLKNGKIDEAKRERLYNVILKSGSNLNSMVENIVSIEQSSTTPVKLSIDAFDIGESVRVVVDSLNALAEEKEITLRCEMDDIPVIMSADRQMLRHVVLNLVSNAVKYTPTGGEVVVKVQAQPHCVMLDVQDTGIGIPSQELSRIFDPYYRVTEHASRIEGTGLGLAIVKRFVEAHDGSIDVSSRIDQGSRFQVRLPYKKSHVAQVKPAGIRPMAAIA